MEREPIYNPFDTSYDELSPEEQERLRQQAIAHRMGQLLMETYWANIKEEIAMNNKWLDNDRNNYGK